MEIRKEKRLDEERLSTIRILLEKYFSNCSSIKKTTIVYLFSFLCVSRASDDFRDGDDKLEGEREYFEGYDGYDIDLRHRFDNAIDLLNDLEKLFKLLKTKNIDTNYLELMKLLYSLYAVKIAKREYIRISNKLGNDIKIEYILQEFIKCPFDDFRDTSYANIITAKLLLEKFGFNIKEKELHKMLEKFIEEINFEDERADLEEFENNISKSVDKKIKHVELPDYNSLNGHQFETFLYDLFKSLGYTAIQTKLSGDQGADLIVMKNGKKTVIQAKKYSNKVTNKAIQEVVAAKKHYNCEKSMVVITSEFTKSAIELAISNDVEIWDGSKLKQIVENINTSSADNNSSDKSNSFTLKEEGFVGNCPYCDSIITIPIEELPLINKVIESECTECGIDISFTTPLDKKAYSCYGCKKIFETVKDRMKHIKICQEVKEREANCKYCNEEYTLDNSEMDELRKNNSAEVECPSCEKINSIIKWH